MKENRFLAVNILLIRKKTALDSELSGSANWLNISTMNAYLLGLSSNKPSQRTRPAALAGCISGAGAIFHRPSGNPKAINPSDGSQSAGQFRVTQEGRTKTIA